MQTNKISFVLLIILIMCLFASCKASDNIKSSSDNLEANIIQTKADADANILDATVNEDTAYLVDPNHIIKYDLASGERSIVKSILGNTAICVDQDSIYIYNQQKNAIVKYNMSGEEKKSYPCSFEPIDAVRMKVCENTIIIVAKYVSKGGYTESELYQIDLSNGNSSKVSSNFKGNDSYSLVVGLDFIDENTIMITSAATTSIMNMVVKGYRFDLKKEKVLEEYILPYSSSYSYDQEKECFYYTDNGLLKGYNPKSSTKVTLSNIENISSSIENNNDPNPIVTRVVDRLFYTKDNVIMYDNIKNMINIIDLSSDKEALKIMLTERVSNYLVLDPIIEQFEKKYDCNVHITEYPQDMFGEKFRTKLLAGDSDYDICFIDNPTKDNLLNSILKYDLYEPLDNYDNIVRNFSHMIDGIQSMMSHKGKVFGVPYYISVTSPLAIQTDFKKYGYTISDKHWSNNDLWKLCDEIIKSQDKNVTVFNDLTEIVLFIERYAQESIDNNKLNKDELLHLLSNIKKYYNAGIFCNQSKTKINIIEDSTMYFWMFMEPNELPDYPKHGTILFPVFDRKIYHNLNGYAMVNKFSKQKELAIKFLEIMTNEENIYNTGVYRCSLLGSDLTNYNKYKEWTDTQLTYLSEVPYLLNSSKVFTCDFTLLKDFVREDIMNGFFDGSITVEDAAEMIYERVNYTYFE